MADYRELVPFVYQAEGGLSDKKTDNGGLTNRGVTYTTWVSYFGDTLERFKSMAPSDWGKIFKQEFWDKAIADDIKDPRVANSIVDWVFNSGKFYPERDIQEVINVIFNKHLAADGNFGPQTIETINGVNQDELYADILQRHREFYQSLCAGDIAILKDKYPEIQDPGTLERLAIRENMKYYPNLRGWLARIDRLIIFNKQYEKPTLPTPPQD
jgi:lysozyme family protein